MANFTIRVELHGNNSIEKYNILHEEMFKNDFSKTIIGQNGLEYYLPSAEYNITSNLTNKLLLENINKIVSQITNDYSVLITRSASRTWHNLKKVEK